MKKYFYADGENQLGPFSIDDLKAENISKETMVWFEGIDNWVEAYEVEELKEIFKSVPPPISSTKIVPPPINSTLGNTLSENKTIIKKSKLGLLLIVSSLAMVTIISLFFLNSNQANNNQTDNNDQSDYENSYSDTSILEGSYTTPPPPPKQKTTEELRQELYEKEKRKPNDYLSVSYKLKYKLLSGKDEISGKIYNTASLATFKDIVLSIKYSTNTGTELLTKDYVVYQFVYPNSSTSFNIKTYSPKGTKQIGVTVKGAKGE